MVFIYRSIETTCLKVCADNLALTCPAKTVQLLPGQGILQLCIKVRMVLVMACEESGYAKQLTKSSTCGKLCSCPKTAEEPSNPIQNRSLPQVPTTSRTLRCLDGLPALPCTIASRSQLSGPLLSSKLASVLQSFRKMCVRCTSACCAYCVCAHFGCLGVYSRPMGGGGHPAHLTWAPQPYFRNFVFNIGGVRGP